MIVKCEQCQTRFKIPDEKVTEKGVKVRCTKCQNTFRVTRDAAATPAPDPFASFGEAPVPKGIDATQPGFFREGVEATKTSIAAPPGKSWHGLNEDVDEEVHDEPTRIGPIPLPPEARPPSASEPTPAPTLARPGVAAARGAPSLFGGSPPPAPAPAGVPPPRPVAAAAPVAVPPSRPAQGASAGAGSLSVAAAPVEDVDPFLDIDLSAPAGPPSPPPAEALRRTAASVPPPATSAAGALALGPVRPSTPAQSTPVSPFDGEDPFASLDFGEPPPAPAQAAPAQPSAPPPPLPRAPAKPAAPLPPSPVDAGPDRSLFDLSDTRMPDEAAEFKVSEPDGESAVGRKEIIDLPEMPGLDDLGGGGGRELIPELSAPVARPAGRPADVGLPLQEGPSAVRRVTGLLINLAVATVLLVGMVAVGSVYLHEGRADLSVLSPSRLQALVAPSRSLVARDVSNGLYETREGAALFFVRGEVENRGTSATRVKVRAALYDGDQRVKSQEGFAGAVPTPEQLHGIVSTEGAAALRTRLDASAKAVPAGGRVPFVLVFQEYPAGLDAFHLEVTLEAEPPSGEAPQGAAK